MGLDVGTRDAVLGRAMHVHSPDVLAVDALQADAITRAKRLASYVVGIGLGRNDGGLACHCLGSLSVGASESRALIGGHSISTESEIPSNSVEFGSTKRFAGTCLPSPAATV